MIEDARELDIAEAQLMMAACIYVDAAEHGAELGDRKRLWDDLRAAVAGYRAALRALPPDGVLVERGMQVVRRLLGEATP